MTVLSTLIHESANGDRWRLCHGDDPADVFVVHEPNGPSGGLPERIALTAFLARAEGSPEQQALLAMIGSLVEAAHLAAAGLVQRPEPGAAAAERTPGEAAAAI